MEIRKSKERGVVVIEPEGRIDTTSAPEFEEAVISELKEGSRRFLIDFGSVEYISSAGLRILLMLAKKLGGEEEELVLCAMNQNVKEVFDISGFTSVFTIEPARHRAMKRLTLSTQALSRVTKALALWSVKPAAVEAGPISDTASLGFELLTGSSLRPAQPTAIELDVAGGAGQQTFKTPKISKTELEAGVKKIGGWIGRLGKR